MAETTETVPPPQPLPMEVDHGRTWSTPFVGSKFGSFEKEAAAAIYVEACRGENRWRAMPPKEFYETLLAMAREKPPPSWVSFMAQVGKPPDVLGLVEGGFFTQDAETQAIEPTEAFFAAVERWTRRHCTPERPMPKGAGGRWVHVKAHEVGEQENGWPSGDVVRVRCPVCGASWKEELPQ